MVIGERIPLRGGAAAPDRLARFRGCLLGLAAGDALGVPLVGAPPETPPPDELRGGGPFRLKAGHWTDETSMALCIADSLVERREFDAGDQLQRLLRWWREGHLASNGRCFDIDHEVREALERFERTRDPNAGIHAPQAAGHAVLCRAAPLAMLFVSDPARAIELAAAASQTTHGAPSAVAACCCLTALLAGALLGTEKSRLLADGTFPPASETDPLRAVAFRRQAPPQLTENAGALETLTAALWAFQHSEDYRTGALLAISLGGDANATGAVYGQLAGAYYGERAIPILWRHRLAHRYLIEAYAVKLFELS